MKVTSIVQSGLKALVRQVKQTADESQSAVSSLGADLQTLAEQTSAALQEVDERLTQMEPVSSFTVAIPTTGWNSDSTPGYPCYRDFAMDGVTANDQVSVAIGPDSLTAAAACGLCPTSETLDGGVRLRAATVPGNGMNAVFWLKKSGEESGISSFVIPTSGWSTDNTADYPCYRDFVVSDLQAGDTLSVAIAPASLQTAIACGLCPASETLEGTLRLRAAHVPAAEISAEYWIDKGKE